MQHIQNQNQNQKNKRMQAASDEFVNKMKTQLSEDPVVEKQEQAASAQTNKSENAMTPVAQPAPSDIQGLQNKISLEDAFSKATSGFQAAKSYVKSEPKEAALIAVTAGLVAWVLFRTKPGRQVMDLASERLAPELAGWITETAKASV